jgi:prepilin-type N-terminal cleavage/methylation domain-containing protein
MSELKWVLPEPNPIDEKVIDTLDSFQDYLWTIKHKEKERLWALMGEIRDCKKLLENRRYGCATGKHAGKCTCKIVQGDSVPHLYNKNRKQKGFTLIEIMIVVAVIGILAITTLPKLTQVVYRAQESMTIANLRVLRSAITAYAVDHEGRYPTDNLACLIAEGYLKEIPLERTPPHDTFAGHPGGNVVGAGPRASWGAGIQNWYYFNDPSEPEWYGKIVVDCGHVDSKGIIWSDR